MLLHDLLGILPISVQSGNVSEDMLRESSALAVPACYRTESQVLKLTRSSFKGGGLSSMLALTSRFSSQAYHLSMTNLRKTDSSSKSLKLARKPYRVSRGRGPAHGVGGTQGQLGASKGRQVSNISFFLAGFAPPRSPPRSLGGQLGEVHALVRSELSYW